MLKEIGKIVAIEPDTVWGEVVRQSSCGSCSVKSGCGTGIAEQLSSGQSVKLPIRKSLVTPLSFSIGDYVELGLPEQALVKAALWTYLLPTLAILVGMAVGVSLGGYWGSELNVDGLAFLGALAGLGLSVVLGRVVLPLLLDKSEVFTAKRKKREKREVPHSMNSEPVILKLLDVSPVQWRH